MGRLLKKSYKQLQSVFHIYYIRNTESEQHYFKQIKKLEVLELYSCGYHTLHSIVMK